MKAIYGPKPATGIPVRVMDLPLMNYFTFLGLVFFFSIQDERICLEKFQHLFDFMTKRAVRCKLAPSPSKNARRWYCTVRGPWEKCQICDCAPLFPLPEDPPWCTGHMRGCFPCRTWLGAWLYSIKDPWLPCGAASALPILTRPQGAANWQRTLPSLTMASSVPSVLSSCHLGAEGMASCWCLTLTVGESSREALSSVVLGREGRNEIDRGQRVSHESSWGRSAHLDMTDKAAGSKRREDLDLMVD